MASEIFFGSGVAVRIPEAITAPRQPLTTVELGQLLLLTSSAGQLKTSAIRVNSPSAKALQGVFWLAQSELLVCPAQNFREYQVQIGIKDDTLVHATSHGGSGECGALGKLFFSDDLPGVINAANLSIEAKTDRKRDPYRIAGLTHATPKHFSAADFEDLLEL